MVPAVRRRRARERSSARRWRSTGLIVAVIAALALGAAAAAVAALNQHSPTRADRSPTSSPPRPTTPPAATHPDTGSGDAAGAVQDARSRQQPPKLPKIPPAPRRRPARPPTGTSTTGSTRPAANRRARRRARAKARRPAKAAGRTPTSRRRSCSTPTPPRPTTPTTCPRATSATPASRSTAITATAWTAQVNPATAPSMAEGVLINLKSAEEALGAQLVSTDARAWSSRSTGRPKRKPPASITDPAWVALSQPLRDQEDQHPLQAAQAEGGLPLRACCGSARPPRRPSGRPPRPAT